jgi:electron-transferring-flavoprotein dehydrogenase
MEREQMEFDVVVVGAGPSGLSCAIKLAQLSKEKEKDISICVIEKGSEVGAHILSGAIIEPSALDELIPDWKEKGAPVKTKVKKDKISFLTSKLSFRLPPPPTMNNHGNYIISLGKLCKWLGEQAEELDIEVFAGFPAAEVLYDENGAVKGVATGDMGVNKDGEKTENYEAGVELIAKQVVFAEGCRGSLTKEVMEKFNLREDIAPQIYGIGIKEIWEVKPENFQEGLVKHTMGWPIDSKTYGGSFIYHMEDNKVNVGFVIGLDYQNPYMDPFEEFQKFKKHPSLSKMFEGARRISYGARALSEGGLQSIPKLSFEGGILVGDCAGFMNIPKIKGIHNSMRSGMIAANAIFEKACDDKGLEYGEEISSYGEKMKSSSIYKELHEVRNIRPAFHYGFLFGLAYSGLDTYILKGKVPFTFGYKPDNLSLKKASECKKIEYDKPDNKITFDKLTSVYESNTAHEEDQPCHLVLKDKDVPVEYNLKNYDAPETRYCPAQVYEIETDENGENPRLKINFTNCLHCKTCDIKDIKQNINWTTPEGGGGPNYSEM